MCARGGPQVSSRFVASQICCCAVPCDQGAHAGPGYCGVPSEASGGGGEGPGWLGTTSLALETFL